MLKSYFGKRKKYPYYWSYSLNVPDTNFFLALSVSKVHVKVICTCLCVQTILYTGKVLRWLHTWTHKPAVTVYYHTDWKPCFLLCWHGGMSQFHVDDKDLNKIHKYLLIFLRRVEPHTYFWNKSEIQAPFRLRFWSKKMTQLTAA